MYRLFDYEDRLASWLLSESDDQKRRVMVDFVADLCERPDAERYFVEWSVDGFEARLIEVPGAGSLVYMLDHINREAVTIRICDP